jgi:hypothetical protein
MSMLGKLTLFVALLVSVPAQAAITIDLSYVDKQSAAYAAFKNFVDDEVGGNQGYGFAAADAAYMYKLTGQAQYATLAVQMVEKQVSDAEAAIALSGTPDIAGDSYLEVGAMLEDLALTYDWCADHTTLSQRTRWAAYAEQAVSNIWGDPAHAKWGNVEHPWSGWAVNDPANNYHYSFLRATLYWGLASNNATWINLLKNTKWPEQENYTASIAGGGSQEGTGYGLSHGTLFMLYRVWHDSIGTDIGNANAHLTGSIYWWIHATVPTLDRVAAIGDQSRVSEPVIYDYHRHLMLEARKVSNNATAQANASWWLHSISDQNMQSGFNDRHNLLPAGPAGSPPASLTYYAPGTGQLFSRTGWDDHAMWLQFAAGPYTQSHAHQDQGSFTLFERGWIAVTENIWTHSGIQQGTETNNVVRFDNAGSIVEQRSYPPTTSTMTVTPGANGAVHAVANLTPAYAGDPALTSWQRTIDFSNHKLTVNDGFTLGSGTTATFQVNTPVQPIINGKTAQAGALTIKVISPVNATLSALNWSTLDINEFNQGWRLDIKGGTTGYVVELSVDAIFADGFQ